jgi:hypothetical protein
MSIFALKRTAHRQPPRLTQAFRDIAAILAPLRADGAQDALVEPESLPMPLLI